MAALARLLQTVCGEKFARELWGGKFPYGLAYQARVGERAIDQAAIAIVHEQENIRFVWRERERERESVSSHRLKE